MEIFIYAIFVVIIFIAIFKSIFISTGNEKPTNHNDSEIQNQIMRDLNDNNQNMINQQNIQNQIHNQITIEQQNTNDL